MVHWDNVVHYVKVDKIAFNLTKYNKTNYALFVKKYIKSTIKVCNVYRLCLNNGNTVLYLICNFKDTHILLWDEKTTEYILLTNLRKSCCQKLSASIVFSKQTLSSSLRFHADYLNNKWAIRNE